VNNDGETSNTKALLESALAAAVPLWIDQLRACSDEQRAARAKECAQCVAEHGDNILYRGKHKGDTALAFNRLAEGLACLAFAPGGVKAFGQHWDAKGTTDAHNDPHQ